VVQAADLADDAVRWWDDNKLLSWDNVTMGFLASMFGMGGKGGGFGNPGDLTMLMNQRSAAGQAASMAPPPQSVAPVAPPMPTVRPVTAPTPTPAKSVPIPSRRPEVLDRVSQNPEVSAKNVETPWPPT
jgi:hypothetical protein